MITFRPAERSQAKPLIEWRSIASFPTYEAGSDGTIRRTETQRVLSAAVERNGYLKVSLYDGKGNSRWVHRLVCEAFHGEMPAPKMDAAHSNHIRSDNRPENLSWKTRSENEGDKRENGTSNSGARNGMSILSEGDVATIRAAGAALPRSSGGARIKKGSLLPLAERFGVTTSCIRQILNNRLWKSPCL